MKHNTKNIKEGRSTTTTRKKKALQELSNFHIYRAVSNTQIFCGFSCLFNLYSYAMIHRLL